MSIPIIGAAIIDDWALTVQITCPCKHTFLLIGQVGTVRQCGKCGKLYCLLGIPQAANPNNPNIVNIPLGFRSGPGGSTDGKDR